MDKKTFLLDANILITAEHTYYPFDFAVPFWEQLQENVLNKRIVVLKVMAKEILKGNDELTEWMRKFDDSVFLDQRQDALILQGYAKVLQHIESSPYYKESALREWSRDTVADPWLIATAGAKQYTLISLEVSAGSRSAVKPARMAKIPDVCRDLQVECHDLFYMMRCLGIKF